MVSDSSIFSRRREVFDSVLIGSSSSCVMAGFTFPLFYGSDPDFWLSEMELMFEEFDIPTDKWVDIALRCLRGSTMCWVFNNASLILEMNWCGFSYGILWEFNPRTTTDTQDLKQPELVVDELVEGLDEPEAELMVENYQSSIEMSCEEQFFPTDSTLEAYDGSSRSDSSLPGNLPISTGLILYKSPSVMSPSSESVHIQSAHKLFDEMPDRDCPNQIASCWSLTNLQDIGVVWWKTEFDSLFMITSKGSRLAVLRWKEQLTVIGWCEIFWDVFGALQAMCWPSMPPVLLRDILSGAHQLAVQDEVVTMTHNDVLWSYTRGFTSSVGSEEVSITSTNHLLAEHVFYR